jgi:hypothetical protein
MKAVTQDSDWWAYLFRVTHREQIEGVSVWDELPAVPYDADHSDRLVVVARKAEEKA